MFSILLQDFQNLVGVSKHGILQICEYKLNLQGFENLAGNGNIELFLF